MIVAFLSVCLLAACGGRTPTPQTAHSKIETHFKKYAHKYKKSDFGQHPVDRVEIVEVREIQKGYAEVDAYAYLSGGQGYKVRVTLRKKPLGWKSIAWENLGPI